MTNINRPSFKFRADCMADAELIRAAFHPWLLSWSTEMTPIEYEQPDGGTRLIRDSAVEVEFTAVANAPRAEELRWLIGGLVNCHVAGDTFQPAHLYTGVRDEDTTRETYTGDVEQPEADALGVAIWGVLGRKKTLEIELERMKHAHRALKSVEDLGARWNAPTGPKRGHLTVLGLNGVDDLHRLVRVTCMNQSKFTHGEVERRVHVINH